VNGEPRPRMFICAHAVRLADGQVFVREIVRGDKELCEALAQRGVDDDVDLSALGDVVEERMVVHPAPEYDEVMRRGG
jgi:hypothetical protein